MVGRLCGASVESNDYAAGGPCHGGSCFRRVRRKNMDTKAESSPIEPPAAEDLAAIEISEAVGELGVRYYGMDRDGKMAFERVYQPSQNERVEVVADRIDNVLRDVSRDSELLFDYLTEVKPQGIKIR